MTNLTRRTAIALPAVLPYAATLAAPAATSATEPDPAIAAFDRFRSALAAFGAVEHDDAAAPANAEYQAAALALAGTVATTPAGLLAQLRAAVDFFAECRSGDAARLDPQDYDFQHWNDGRDVALYRSLIAGAERLTRS